jgi:broad specificity phosphatase PhoE
MLIGTAVFLRHGQTDYTGIFPDLTPEGIETMRASAVAIKQFCNGHPGLLNIVSSPTVRAMGSSSILAKELDFKDAVREAPLLRAAQIFDKEKAAALFREHFSNGGMRSICIKYDTDPRFEDGKFIEPRSRVRKRFFKYLGMLSREFMALTSPMFVVHVSHHEVLYSLVQEVFQLDYQRDEPLGHGEVIMVSFHHILCSDVVELQISFRGKKIDGIIFDHKREEIVAGSYS